jgi:tryptophan halogenase
MMERPRQITVIGEGTDAALAAAMLARSLGRQGTQVICLQPEPVGEDTACVLLDPRIAALHSALGFSETDFMRNCQAVYWLGVHVRVPERSVDFVLAQSPYGASLGRVPFYTSFGREDLGPGLPAFDHFSLAARLGRANRFAHPETLPPGPANAFRYGYQADRAAYAQYLFRAAAHYGARVEHADIRIQPADGASAPQVHAHGVPVTSDLIILATRHLPATAVQHPASIALTSPTEPRCLSSLVMSTQGFTTTLTTQIGFEHRAVTTHTAPDLATHDPGKHWPWEGNTLRLGESAFTLLPLEAGASRLLAGGITELLALLPGTAPTQPLQAEYNRRMQEQFAREIDLQALHAFLARGASDTDRTTLSPANARRIEQFMARGRIVTYDFDPNGADGFAAIFYGYGYRPRTVNLAGSVTPPETLRAGMERLSRSIGNAVNAAPALSAYMAQVRAVRLAASAKKASP